MSPPEPTLAELQRWLVEVVSHGPSLEASLARPAALRLLSLEAAQNLVQGPGPLDGVAGVGIYHRMYRLRLGEALETDFPALRAVAGAERFDILVRDYLETHPSSSWTLSRLGDQWPDHLATTQEAWVAELARLELLQTLAIQSPAAPRMDADALAQVPPEAFTELRLVPIPSLRLLEASHEVVALYEAYRDEEPLGPPAPVTTRIAVYRDERVEQLVLEAAPFRLLAALVDGQTLGEAIDQAYPEPTEDDAAELQSALAEWTSCGLFSSIKL